jgi:hypothetical protein
MNEGRIEVTMTKETEDDRYEAEAMDSMVPGLKPRE